MGFSPEKADELDMDIVEAFVSLQQEEYAIEWEQRIKTLQKLVGKK